MSRREAICRYNLIINKLRKGHAAFTEISDYLQRESELQEYKFDVSVRTFQRDIKDIRSIYGIDISYSRSLKKYGIDPDGSQEVQDRILEAFDTMNALNLSDRLSGFIHFENRRAKGTENLYELLRAIKSRFQVSFVYQKFWENEASLRKVEPYALKEFKNRWYLLAKDLSKNGLRIFGLDRLSNLEISRNRFRATEAANVAEYFKHSFGIIIGEGSNAEEVILSFTRDQGKYIKSLPLRESQQILVDNELELRISLKLHVTFDLVQEILSHGPEVRVIQPESLVAQVKSSYENSVRRY